MCPMIQYSPGVSAGIKMSDATLHDAYTPTARKADAMKLICLSREIVQLDSRGGTWDEDPRVSQVGWLTLCGELGTVSHQVAGQGPPVPAAYLPRPTALPANPFIIHECPDQGYLQVFPGAARNKGIF